MKENKLVDISQFSNERFEEAKPFTPFSPLGDKLEGATLYVRSTHCRDAKKIINRIMSRMASRYRKIQNEEELSLDRDEEEKDNIELATIVLEKVEGLTIDGDKDIGSDKEMIKLLMTNYDWLRRQVISKAEEDSFFYKAGSES